MRARAVRSGRLAEAADHHHQALTLNQRIGRLGGQATNLGNLGVVYLEQGACKLPSTITPRRWPCSASLATATARAPPSAGWERSITPWASSTGPRPQALASYGQALDLARTTQSRYPEVVALLGLAAAHQHLDHLDQAHSCAQQALTLARRTGYRLLEGQALTTVAGTQLPQDQPHRAIEHASQALAIQRDTGHRLGQAHTLLILGHALRTEGADAALPHWQQALALFAEIGTPEADHAHALVRTCAAAADHQ